MRLGSGYFGGAPYFVETRDEAMAVTHRKRRRIGGRDPWSALLAVLLSALASAAALGPDVGFARGLSVAGHGADAHPADKAVLLRVDISDPSLRLGGNVGADAVLPSRGGGDPLWPDVTHIAPAADFGLVVDVARTRDGLTRAPPRA